MHCELHLDPELTGWSLHFLDEPGEVFDTYDAATDAARHWAELRAGRRVLVHCDMGTTTTIVYRPA